MDKYGQLWTKKKPLTNQGLNLQLVPKAGIEPARPEGIGF